MKPIFLNGSPLGRWSDHSEIALPQGNEVWGTHRLWFFNEAGWLETPPAITESTITRMTTPRCTKAEVLS
jgi:hypothetical protein